MKRSTHDQHPYPIDARSTSVFDNFTTASLKRRRLCAVRMFDNAAFEVERRPI
jgi:hypothetical protein